MAKRRVWLDPRRGAAESLLLRLSWLACLAASLARSWEQKMGTRVQKPIGLDSLFRLAAFSLGFIMPKRGRGHRPYLYVYNATTNLETKRRQQQVAVSNPADAVEERDDGGNGI